MYGYQRHWVLARRGADQRRVTHMLALERVNDNCGRHRDARNRANKVEEQNKLIINKYSQKLNMFQSYALFFSIYSRVLPLVVDVQPESLRAEAAHVSPKKDHSLLE